MKNYSNNVVYTACIVLLAVMVTGAIDLPVKLKINNGLQETIKVFVLEPGLQNIYNLLFVEPGKSYEYQNMTTSSALTIHTSRGVDELRLQQGTLIDSFRPWTAHSYQEWLNSAVIRNHWTLSAQGKYTVLFNLNYNHSTSFAELHEPLQGVS